MHLFRLSFLIIMSQRNILIMRRPRSDLTGNPPNLCLAYTAFDDPTALPFITPPAAAWTCSAECPAVVIGGQTLCESGAPTPTPTPPPPPPSPTPVATPTATPTPTPTCRPLPAGCSCTGTTLTSCAGYMGGTILCVVARMLWHTYCRTLAQTNTYSRRLSPPHRGRSDLSGKSISAIACDAFAGIVVPVTSLCVHLLAGALFDPHHN